MNHDVITIGASAGGIEILFELVADLPRELEASVFVVVHMLPGHASALPELLAERGPLAASHPLHGEPIRPGHIYVAPPDNHLMLRVGTMEVVRGPKENGHRPAADALFRSAATAYGPRVIGVVLTGYQDCGTAGLLSIKARGGLAVVQSPDTAFAPEMPESALARVPVDHVAMPRDLGALLGRLATTPVERPPLPPAWIEPFEGRAPGAPAELTCPACHGVLTLTQVGGFEHFRCHVGHAFTLDALRDAQDGEIERALWSAVRALEESAAFNDRLVASASGRLRDVHAERAKTLQREAELVRDLLLHGTPHT